MKHKFPLHYTLRDSFGFSLRKKLIVAAGLLFLFLVSSCNKFLDVHPDGELTGKQLLKDAEGFESALYGVYGTMADPDLYGGQLSHNAMDLLAQYFTCFGNDNAENLLKYNYNFSGIETILENIWAKSYSNIAYANNVLENLKHFSPEDLEYYNLYKGEALGLRAFIQFDLVRLFGENIQLDPSAKGIPYSTGFSLKAPDFISLSADYDSIITDLKRAEKLLAGDSVYFNRTGASATSFLKDREIHFNYYAAQATLARVYLAKGDLPHAALYAEKVINSGQFRLMNKTDIGNGVGKGMLYPNETIFGLYSQNYFTTVRDRFLLQTSFYSYDVRADISSVYNDGQGGHDYRWDGFFKQPTTSTGKLRFVKLVDPYQQNDQEYARPAGLIKGINLIRLPEMYYIAAEALLNTSPGKAQEYFDAILTSRGITALEDRIPAQLLTLEMITRDRYKEFIGEGQSFFNMKRLHIGITGTTGQVIPAGKSIYVPPIPKKEFDYRN